MRFFLFLAQFLGLIWVTFYPPVKSNGKIIKTTMPDEKSSLLKKNFKNSTKYYEENQGRYSGSTNKIDCNQ